MTATEAPFQWDFLLERKSIQETASGDVIVSGYASTWDEDRHLEAFLPGAFQKGLRRFLTTNPQVLWMHDYTTPLGVVEDARIDRQGLWVRCRLDAPTPGSKAEDIVRRVVRGSLKAFSVGGIWHRRQTPQGPRIHTADLMEVSIASVPVNASALVSHVEVARKSFENAPNNIEELKAMKRKLADLKAALAGRAEPEPRATMLYADDDPDRVRREQKGFEAQRQHEAHRQSQLVDGVNEAEVFEGTAADLFGYEVQRQAADNVRVEREVTLSPDQWAALNGVAGKPVTPTMAGSFLDQKLKEARAGEVRRKLLAPLDKIEARKREEA